MLLYTLPIHQKRTQRLLWHNPGKLNPVFTEEETEAQRDRVRIQKQLQLAPKPGPFVLTPPSLSLLSKMSVHFLILSSVS